MSIFTLEGFSLPSLSVAARKRRTREHVIAEMGVNHFEWHVLRCGYTLQRLSPDYGLDLNLLTFDETGEQENGLIHIQVKATDTLKLTANKREIRFALDLRDVRHWVAELLPVILVVYDAKQEKAYWLYIQHYFSPIQEMNIDRIRKKISVRIPVGNRVNKSAVRRFSRFRDECRAEYE